MQIPIQQIIVNWNGKEFNITKKIEICWDWL